MARSRPGASPAGLEKYGKNVAAYLCLSAKELSPEEAMRMGVVLDVFEDDELLPKCEELARRIAGKSYIAKTFIKTTLNRKACEDYQDAERFMADHFCHQSHERSVCLISQGRYQKREKLKRTTRKIPMKEVVIVSAARTPIGTMGGSLARFRQRDLASIVMKSVAGTRRRQPGSG